MNVRYVADEDNKWFREVVVAPCVANPHSSVVAYATPERGVAQFAVLCSSCGQVAVSPDKARIEALAREHSARVGA